MGSPEVRAKLRRMHVRKLDWRDAIFAAFLIGSVVYFHRYVK